MNNPESIAAALNKNGTGSRKRPDPARIAKARQEIKEGKGLAIPQLRQWFRDKCGSLRKKK